MLDIKVIDLGGDRQFAKARKYIDGMLDSLVLREDKKNPDASHKIAECEVYRPKSRYAVSMALLDNVGLIHVMAHGVEAGKLQGQRLGRPRILDIDDHRQVLASVGYCPSADGILLDACETYSDEWLAEVASILPARRRAVVIAPTSEIDWYLATTYTSAFYSALLRGDRLHRRPDLRRASYLEAHKRAQAAYRTVTGSASDFRATEVVGTWTRT